MLRGSGLDNCHPREGKLSDTASREWQTVYESQPCLPLKHARGSSFAGLQIGGRIKALGENRLLLTVGDHQFDGWFGTPDYVEDPRASYGKTILLDLANGTASISPRVTATSRDSRWTRAVGSGRQSTVPWAATSSICCARDKTTAAQSHYGTEYSSVTWPLNERHLGPANYVRPIYAWVPSIGVSNLVAVRDSAFERWRNDLLIASLRGKELWRVRVEEGRVVYAEPILIGERIRDITTGGRGEFVLWTDQETIIRITPARGLDRGAEAFVLNCGSCHGMQFNGVGPSLDGLVGRSVASAPEYEYSNALRRLGGKWTAERLNGFLTHPDSVAPGTAMRFDGVSDSATRSAIIAYLRSYPTSAH